MGVLFSTPELRINNDNVHVHRTPISGHVQHLPPNKHAHRTIEYPGNAQTAKHVDRTFLNTYKHSKSPLSLRLDEV